MSREPAIEIIVEGANPSARGECKGGYTVKIKGDVRPTNLKAKGCGTGHICRGHLGRAALQREYSPESAQWVDEAIGKGKISVNFTLVVTSRYEKNGNNIDPSHNHFGEHRDGLNGRRSQRGEMLRWM